MIELLSRLNVVGLTEVEKSRIVATISLSVAKLNSSAITLDEIGKLAKEKRKQANKQQ